MQREKTMREVFEERAHEGHLEELIKEFAKAWSLRPHDEMPATAVLLAANRVLHRYLDDPEAVSGYLILELEYLGLALDQCVPRCGGTEPN